MITDSILRIFQPLDTRLTPILMRVADFAYARLLKPVLVANDWYATYINVPIAKAIDGLSMRLQAKANSLTNRWARRLGRFAAFAVGLGLHVVLFMANTAAFFIYNTAAIISLNYLAGVPLATVFSLWLLPMLLSELEIGATLSNFFAFGDKFSNLPENPRLILLQKSPIRAVLELGIEQSISHIIHLVTALAKKILPWRRQAAAERAAHEAAQQLIDASFEVDAAPIENAFTAVLDQALAANDFRIALDFLRPHTENLHCSFTINWPADLKEMVNNNKYTMDPFWEGITVEECDNLEHAHPELCCTISHEFMRVPVYVVRPAVAGQTQEHRSYFDLSNLLRYTQLRGRLDFRSVTFDPETRVPIRSLDDIQYDHAARARIQSIIQAYKEARDAPPVASPALVVLQTTSQPNAEQSRYVPRFALALNTIRRSVTFPDTRAAVRSRFGFGFSL